MDALFVFFGLPHINNKKLAAEWMPGIVGINISAEIFARDPKWLEYSGFLSWHKTVRRFCCLVYVFRCLGLDKIAFVGNLLLW